MSITITQPGIFDMPDDVYHSDPCFMPSLSSSGAKTILNKSPYHYWYEREHGQSDTGAFHFGRAAHMAMLEPERFAQTYHITPEGFSRHHHKKWEKELAELVAAEAAGAIELKAKDAETVETMAAAMAEHRDILGQFFAAPKEQSAFWFDETFKIWRRCRFDFMANPGGRIFVDYKTVEPRGQKGIDDAFLLRQVLDYGYHQQAAWYLDGIEALGLCDHEAGPAFIFLFQEKKPPYAMRLVQLPDSAIDMGRVMNAKAMDMFARGVETNVWPSYDREVLQLPWPQYLEDRFDRDTSEGHFELTFRMQAPWFDKDRHSDNDNHNDGEAA